MTDPATRIRTLILASFLLVASWGAIAALGRPGCGAFSNRETRELAGLPIPPACIEERLPPGGPLDRLPALQPEVTP